VNQFGPWARDADLAASLSARESEGIPLERWLAWPDAWAPEPQACHANADRWVAMHAGWTVARGWVLQYGVPGEGAAYVAHSVVADPAGRLLEVTLLDDVLPRFLAHLGDLSIYAQHVSSRRWSIVREAVNFPEGWMSRPD
jgi:hypothetical protein